MATRITTRLLAAATLWAGFGLTAQAQIPAITAEKAFEVKPRQAGVSVSTPAADQVGKCRVEPIPGQTPGQNMGYVVRDPAGRPVRQFVSYDNKSFNIVAFYIDGQEAYREIFPLKPGEAHQYRWLGANGSKWGLDNDRDGRIDEWAVLSPEEASQELLQALPTKDAKRLDALLPTKENLDGLKLPPAETNRIRERAANAVKKLTAAADALKLSPQAKWIHLELGLPHTTPGDAFGPNVPDLVTHTNGIVLIEDGGKSHFLQTGELLLVGRAWKVIEGPTAGPGGLNGTADLGAQQGGPYIDGTNGALVGKLDELDKKMVGKAQPTQAELADYYAKRSAIVEEIIQATPADRQAEWVKVLIDSLTAAAEGERGTSKAVDRLRQLKTSLGQNPLGAYAAFRVLVAENSIALAAEKPDIPAIQEKWRAALEAFVKSNPTADDAPDAVLRLAMSFEFVRKESEAKEAEAKAKQWYDHLVKTYAAHPHAAKAAGAVKRLESEGKVIELQGTTTAGQQYLPGHTLGKVVVVYYWASWSSSLADDVKKLRDLKTTYGPKGLEIVTVCLDDDAKGAVQAAAALQLPGVHLHSPGGLDKSPLAAGYGIHVAPHLFLVNKEAKVVNRNAQIVNVEDEIKKLVN